MSDLTFIQQHQCADRLQADATFAFVQAVLTERIADIQSEVDRALGPLNAQGGKDWFCGQAIRQAYRQRRR